MSAPAKRFLCNDFSRRSHRFEAELIAPRTRRLRLLLVVLGATLWSGLLIFRLSSLQITNKDTWQEWAVRQHLADEGGIAEVAFQAEGRQGHAQQTFVGHEHVSGNDRADLVAEMCDVALLLWCGGETGDLAIPCPFEEGPTGVTARRDRRQEAHARAAAKSRLSRGSNVRSALSAA